MTCAGRSRSRSLALPVSARTCRTWSSGNVLAITPRLTWSLRRMPAGRPAGARAIAITRSRVSASMAQLQAYVSSIEVSPEEPLSFQAEMAQAPKRERILLPFALAEAMQQVIEGEPSQPRQGRDLPCARPTGVMG